MPERPQASHTGADRYTICDEAHKQSRRRSDANRRAAAEETATTNDCRKAISPVAVTMYLTDSTNTPLTRYACRHIVTP